MHELLQAGLLPLCLAILFASAVQGASGFGMAMVAVPLLATFMSLRIAVPVLTLCGFAVVGQLIVRYRAHCDWVRAAWLGIPVLILAPFGAHLLEVLPANQLRLGLGVVLLASAMKNLVMRRKGGEDPAVQDQAEAGRQGDMETGRQGDTERGGGAMVMERAAPPRIRQVSRMTTVCVGGVAGVVGGALGMTGPLLADHLIKTGISREEFKITLNLIFLFSAIWRTVLYFHEHLLTGVVLSLGLIGFPIALAGCFLGSTLSHRLKREIFTLSVQLFLAVIGVCMVISGIRGH